MFNECLEGRREWRGGRQKGKGQRMGGDDGGGEKVGRKEPITVVNQTRITDHIILFGTSWFS